MRLTRLLLLPAAVLSVAACSEDDGFTVNNRPPLGGVRFINAVPDMGPMDIRMVDQIQWSASSVSSNASGQNGLGYRQATIHWPTEAKARHIRVWPNSSDLETTSRVLHDVTVTIEPDKNVTLMLVPGPRTGANDSVAFVVISDDVPTLNGQQIAVRAVNAGVAGGIAAYATATTSSALGTPVWTITEQYGAPTAPGINGYAVRDTGSFAMQVAAAAAPTTALASSAAPAGTPQSGLVGAAAGYRGALSGFSAWVFPRACPELGADAPVADNCVALRDASASEVSSAAGTSIMWFVDKAPPPPGRPTTTP